MPFDLEGDVAVLFNVVVGLGALMEGVAVYLELVYERDVAGVYSAFHRLQVVAFLQPLGDEHVTGRQVSPLHAGRRGLLVRRTHVGPHHAGALDARIAID